MAEDQLQEAYQLIKAGQKIRAEALLRPLVEADADNADAWWLLANAIQEPDEIRAALGQVLRLRPDHAKAHLMLRRTNDRYPPEADEPERSIEDLFNADYDEDAPRRVNVTKPKHGSNRAVVIVLVVIGVLSTISCAACLLAVGGVAVFGEMLNDPDFDELMTLLVEGMESEFASKTHVDQGTIERGQTVRRDLGPYTEHTWTFEGTAGDEILIDLKALASDLDPVLHLYGPGGGLVAENDDREGSYDSLIEIELSQDGQYTIVVSGFDDSGGRYELKLAINGPLV